MSTDVTMAFADRLQELIADSGKPIKDLAAEIGVSAGALSKYQNDAAEAGIDALAKISKYFDVSTDWLLGFTNDRSRTPSAIDELQLTEGAVGNIKRQASRRVTGEVLQEPREGSTMDIFNKIVSSFEFWMIVTYIQTLSRASDYVESYSKDDDQQASEFFHIMDTERTLQKKLNRPVKIISGYEYYSDILHALSSLSKELALDVSGVYESLNQMRNDSATITRL